MTKQKQEMGCSLCGSRWHPLSKCPWTKIEKPADPEQASQLAVAYMLAEDLKERFITDGKPNLLAQSQNWTNVEQVEQELFIKAVDRVVKYIPPPVIKTEDVPFHFEDEVAAWKEKLDYTKE